MATIILEGDEHAIAEFLIGALGELRFDSGNDSLRLHDGVKEGGYEFLNRDENDNRYQFHSEELDGFSFGAQEKGIVTRVGPANYKTRKLVSTNLSIALDNPKGTLGDFDIEIAPTVPSDHTWTGVQTYTQPIQGEGGFIGNVTGDLTGDSTGLHTGDVVGNLTGNTFGTHTGNVDLRGATLITDFGQITEDQIDLDAWKKWGVPVGVVVMWSGLVADIPDSWALCDGSNGTPDLRDRFIIGAGGTFSELDTGGTANHTHTGTVATSGAHDHTGTSEPHVLIEAELPKHKHGNGITDAGSSVFNHGILGAVPTTTQQVQNSSGSGSNEGYTTEVGNNIGHSHDIAISGDGEHNHDFTLDDATLLPPYYALCFIMKIVFPAP